MPGNEIGKEKAHNESEGQSFIYLQKERSLLLPNDMHTMIHYHHTRAKFKSNDIILCVYPKKEILVIVMSRRDAMVLMETFLTL